MILTVRENDLLRALLPFAIAIEEHGETSAVDDAFIWEGAGGYLDKPLVTYGSLRAARDAVRAAAPGLLETRFWRREGPAND